ncbi:MAG: spermidine synthase [Gemmatimonadaceae bacterium]
MIFLFGLAALTSAFLIFWVEPLFAKLVLPLLGGSPAVWNTCLMFFQALLLLGYLYAHASSRYLPPRRQIILHASLIAVCFIQLPLALPEGWAPPASGNVIPWLVAVLTVSLGAPFFVLSATAPLLQRWVASARDPVKNPYVLYAASNAGSFLGLLAFPLLLEPSLRLSEQTRLWTWVYVVAFVLIAACGAAIWRRLPDGKAATDSGVHPDVPKPVWRERVMWVLLAFVPSSLLLGVTTYLSTDIAATPLLWVIPLALYLLTFVIVFSNSGKFLTGAAASVHAILVTALALIFFWQVSIGFERGYALHLGVFAFTTLVLHGRLAASRPHPAHLTEFYLWMAFGGALGGAFTALVVPLLFDSTRDYLMMVVIACFLRPTFRLARSRRRLELRNIAIVLLPAVFLYAASRYDLETHMLLGVSSLWIICFVAGVVVVSLMTDALRFGLAIAAIAVTGHFLQTTRAVLYADRSFFGVYRVARAPGPAMMLYHGTTIHGAQFTERARRLTPITYYHPAGPVGDVFRELAPSLEGADIGIVGLGTGSILCFSRPGERWTFYEIDPKVEAIARDKRFFTYMSDCEVAPTIVLGDARLTLAREPEAKYSLLVVDAFSSDAIPVHLLTREAVETYFRALTEDGVLMVHISNRRLDLEPVVADLALDAGLEARVKNHSVSETRQDTEYDYESDWVIMARRLEDFGPLAADTMWVELEPSFTKRPWTDDYSNILSVIRR